MTTFAEARAELVDALADVGNGATSNPGRIIPPAVYIAGDGAAVDHVMAGKFRSTWRCVLVAGLIDLEASAAQLDAMKSEAITALRGLAEWRMEPLGRDGQRDFGGQGYLTAELRGSRMIDG